ncbi:MFS transporter [Clostridium thermarum]|uniref:MFS transporter n=1 Tax=Clostridium thermarum TaxID=1716543 RepID=UPI001123D3BC|nr:MFS transporter [Clostridium thermarum]
MATFFLVIIYLSFISLGLPDSLLGVSWPLLHLDINAPFEAAGLISMIVAGGTIVSSFVSGRVIKALGTGKIAFISCLMTAAALLGISFAPSLIWLILLAIPLGLGAGSVDTALNNYVALHYKSYHMSWLHCFWGVGASIGPIIMSRFISKGQTWRYGYLTVSIIQFVLVVILLAALPLWIKAERDSENNESGSEEAADSTSVGQAAQKPLKIKGVKLALVSFLFYCGTESTMGLWGSSFLVNVKNISAATAASWVSLYYTGITVGRFISGFLTLKMSNRMMIRTGQTIALCGALLLLLPLPSIFSLFGFMLVGLGCAPIYPCMLHETPVRFGKENSQMLMGYQMAFAYTGSTFLPPLLGVIASRTSISIMPFFVVFYIATMLIGSETLNAYLYKLKSEV